MFMSRLPYDPFTASSDCRTATHWTAVQFPTPLSLVDSSGLQWTSAVQRSVPPASLTASVETSLPWTSLLLALNTDSSLARDHATPVPPAINSSSNPNHGFISPAMNSSSNPNPGFISPAINSMSNPNPGFISPAMNSSSNPNHGFSSPAMSRCLRVAVVDSSSDAVMMSSQSEMSCDAARPTSTTFPFFSNTHQAPLPRAAGATGGRGGDGGPGRSSVSSSSALFHGGKRKMSNNNNNGSDRLSHTHTYIHPFNGPLSRTTRVSRRQKGKNQSGFLLFQVGHMQVCTSLVQTDTTPAQAGCPSCRQPTASKH